MEEILSQNNNVTIGSFVKVAELFCKTLLLKSSVTEWSGIIKTGGCLFDTIAKREGVKDMIERQYSFPMIPDEDRKSPLCVYTAGHENF